MIMPSDLNDIYANMALVEIGRFVNAQTAWLGDVAGRN